MCAYVEYDSAGKCVFSSSQEKSNDFTSCFFAFSSLTFSLYQGKNKNCCILFVLLIKQKPLFRFIFSN